MKKKYLFLLLFGIALLVSCKRDEKTINQVGNWVGTSRTELYTNDSLRIYNRDVKVSINSDNTASFLTDEILNKEYEWYYLDDNEQILLVEYRKLPQYRDTQVLFYDYNILVNEKNYQEWIREQSPGSSIWRRTDEYKLERVE